MQEALRLTPAQFLSTQGDPVTAPQGAMDHLDWMLAQRAQRMPVSHILGHVTFWGRSFDVTQDTLAPRPETEGIIEHALSAPFDSVLDLGTGSGCLAVTLLAERPQVVGVATDISASALSVARRNAQRHHVLERLNLVETCWDAGLQEHFDLIVSNPPYVSSEQWQALEPEIREYEPQSALLAGEDGLDAYRAIAPLFSIRLAPQGRVIFEIGPAQGGAVSQILKSCGLQEVSVSKDFAGRDRIVSGKAPYLRL